MFKKPYTKNHVTVTIHFTEAWYWKSIHEEGNIWRRWFLQLNITRAQQLERRLFISMQYVFWDSPITKKTASLVCKVEWPVFAMKSISLDAFEVISYEGEMSKIAVTVDFLTEKLRDAMLESVGNHMSVVVKISF